MGFGGATLATSTFGTSAKLSEKDLMTYSVFEVTPNIGSFTYTLPATNTMSSLLQRPGDTQRWIFKNATTTVATTLTIVKGTGWDLTGVDANVDVIAGAAVGSQVFMIMDCTRLTATSTGQIIFCELREDIAAD